MTDSGQRRVAIVVHAVVPGDPRVRRQSDALVEAGWEVDTIALRRRGEAAEETHGPLRIVRLPIDRWFSGLAGHLSEYLAFAALATARLAYEHRRRRYRLVQIATVPDFLVVAALPEKMAGVPLLLDLHEDMPEFYRDRFAAPLSAVLLPVVRGVARASAALADELVTVHEPLRRLAIRRGVPPDKISVVMNGADADLFDPERHRRRTFMAGGELRLIHHSSLQRIYGLDIAVEAMARLRPGLPARLDVYGDGPYRRQVQAAIDRTGTSDRVHLHGFVPMDDLPRILAEADIGLVPTLPEPYMAHSLSTKLLEYAAMGVPTIASDLATFRDHFDDRALRYVAGGNPTALARAIESLADDAALGCALGAEAQRQAASYSWGVQKERYLAIVERLASAAYLPKCTRR